MNKHLLSLLIASVAVVSCDKPTPCDEVEANKYLLPNEIKDCKSNACVEWIVKRAADAEKRCAEYRSHER